MHDCNLKGLEIIRLQHNRKTKESKVRAVKNSSKGKFRSFQKVMISNFFFYEINLDSPFQHQDRIKKKQREEESFNK